jgi:hypothetical protein
MKVYGFGLRGSMWAMTLHQDVVRNRRLPVTFGPLHPKNINFPLVAFDIEFKAEQATNLWLSTWPQSFCPPIPS